MRLFGRYQGEYALDCAIKDSVDAVASSTGNTVYLHLANTDIKRDKVITLDTEGAPIESVTVHYIAENPATEITPVNTDVFDVKALQVTGNEFTLPRAAVAAVEIKLKEEA